jgi:hypothetical protein
MKRRPAMASDTDALQLVVKSAIADPQSAIVSSAFSRAHYDFDAAIRTLFFD